jgi:hypothetical protein
MDKMNDSREMIPQGTFRIRRENTVTRAISVDASDAYFILYRLPIVIHHSTNIPLLIPSLMVISFRS